jgi:hypothetical protein
MYQRKWISVLTMSLLVSTVPLRADTAPDFTSDVRPIIAHHCLKCHGPDDAARKGKLRLDMRDTALAKVESGDFAIVPGNTERGTLLKRIFSTDDDDVMPPPGTKNALTDTEKQTLKRWIAAGAPYKEHWAFVAPVQAPLPAVKQADWPKNPIDRFILAKLESQGLHPSPAADRATLIRRVSLDLIGLPPTPEEVDAFVADTAPDAYEKVVDRLLANPHFGERWARRWLDLARYADTNGYEKDRQRSIWPYRDWVIRAINADMPFDEFTIEQLAGDMLPNATLDQRIATGFHRNTMINEEGGIDPLEFRWKAVIDRANVTATTWLGLTLGCAQCHTHKFDPIKQTEYYQMVAFFNNCDEPTIDVPQPDHEAEENEIGKAIAAKIADLPNQFPVGDQQIHWSTPAPTTIVSAGGASSTVLPDGSILLGGKRPLKDSCTITMDSDLTGVEELKLEVLKDPSLPHHGPGRAENGNFVLSKVSFSVAPHDAASDAETTLPIAHADADYSQPNFAVAGAIGTDIKTGWAIDSGKGETADHAATFKLAHPAGFPGARWTIQLDQNWGEGHLLGRFRISLGFRLPEAPNDSRPLAERRQSALQKSFEGWLAGATARAVQWSVLRPVDVKANAATLHVMDDNSVFASGDQTKRDVYDLKFAPRPQKITAIRLEALPDDRLPNRGPGRIYYEGPAGGFFLSAMTLTASGQPLSMNHAVQTLADGANTAAGVIDTDPLTGWAIGAGKGEPQTAIFTLDKPLDLAGELALSLVFEKYYSAPLGRFRISVTSDPRVMAAPAEPTDVEEILTTPAADRSADQRDRLLTYFLSIAPELSPQHAEIARLRASIPKDPTTLVLSERPISELRPTHLHHRGEYLQPMEVVQANTLSILPPLPAGAPHNRLSLARWLVDPRNPLTARVTANRQWAAFFGTGIVSTLADFGYQGETPTNPELLDWLAVELIKQGWSMKKIDRLIVTSATYQQSSRVTPELLEKDPQNRLLSRAPRVRLEAEQVRDCLLSASGLLSPKIGGPSVFPPQPASVTTEGAYGALEWKVSSGEDRYRRGLYTFMKRTAPYAMFVAFDAPSGEACVARRDVSDTPLQALTLLNDEVFVDAARALGKLTAAQPGDDQAKIIFLFRRCLARKPDDEELALVSRFHDAQEQRFLSHELTPADVTGDSGASPENAAWVVTARAILNLDETITKN